MQPRLAMIAAALAIVAVGCQPAGVVPSSAPATTLPSPTNTTPPSTPEAGATIDPEWITRPALTCGDPERRFPPEAIAGVGLAELGLDPAAEVLRRLLAGDSYPGFPASGWHRVIDDAGGVTFVARGNREMPWAVVTVGILNGELQPTEYGQCHLQPVAPDGVTLAHWWLDPAAPLPTSESTEIAILLRETACASGKPPVGRVLPPTVILNPDAILVVIGVAVTPGGSDCQGNPAFPLELTLPEPLGTRGLFDAGVFPPRAVTTEDPG